MTYGFQINNASGTTVVSPTSPAGGLFIQSVIQTAGTSQTYTFSAVPGASYLRIIQVGAGGHSWTTGTNGSGYATLTVTAISSSYVSFSDTTLLVFSTYTTESGGYGILTTNDSGERVISGVYKTPQFVQKLNSSSWSIVNNGAIQAPSSYNLYVATITIPSISSARQRYILFDLPSNGTDTWYSFQDTYVPSSFTSSFTMTASVFATATPAMPNVYIFALDGAIAATSGYGIQMWDSSGNVTFNSNATNMHISNIAQSVSFPIGSGSEPIGTIKTFSGAYVDSSPVSVVPEYYQQRLTRNGPSDTFIDDYTGGCRRNGTSLQTQLFYVSRISDSFTGPTSPITYNIGNYDGLFVPSLPGSLY